MSKYKEILGNMNNFIEEYKEDSKMTNFAVRKDISIIQLDLRDSDIYQEFSGESLLKQEVFDFIEKTYHFIKKNQKIQIQILFKENTSLEEQEKIKKLIRIHYAVQFKETCHEIRKTNKIASIVLLIGAILFAIYGLLEWYKVNFIFQGIIEIFSWVFIWEACSLYTFTNSENKIQRIRYLRLYNSATDL